jgi:pectate lyase
MFLNKYSLPVLAVAATAVTATAVAPQVLTSPVAASTRAFPGAEGFGTDTPGGRDGAVCAVTSLADSGAGTLRSCVERSGPRYVVFKTGGTITLRSRINVTNPYVTIAGQTAPGGGITLRMDPSAGTDQGTLQIATHDVVVRYLRFRPGDGGAADDSNDAITIYKGGVRNVVVDHSSFSWAVDENVNTYDGSTDITVSNSIIAEGLSNAGHPDGEHSKGMLSGGVDAHNVSIHHNLFVSNVDRNPQISGVSVADVRNNVVYNYGDGSGSGVTLISSSKGEPRVNWVGNYYRPGPNSDPNRAEFATYNGSTGASHQWYGDGNMRWTAGGDQPARISSEAVGRVTTPFPAAPVTTTSAAAAYEQVLADAGALPLWIGGGGTPESAARAGRLGIPMNIAILGGPARFAGFANLYRKAGGTRVAVSSHGLLGDDAQEAKQAYVARWGHLMRRGLKNRFPPRDVPDEALLEETGPRGAVFAGDAKEAIAKARWEREILGIDRLLLQMDWGGMPYAKVARSIEILGTEVAPELRKDAA